MKRIYLVISAISFLFLQWMVSSCGRDKSAETGMWHSGDESIDRLLNLGDQVDEVGDYDNTLVDSLMPVIGRMAYQRGDSALGEWAFGRKAFVSEDFAAAERHFRKAEKAAGEKGDDYLLARIRFDLSRSLPDDSIERKADFLFESMREFYEAGDSLRVMQSLFDINMVYGYVWDDEMQTSCLEEAARFVPDSLEVLRGLMQLNVLGLKRDGKDTTAYLQLLDSLRRDRMLMENVPPLGIMVNTDLYRLGKGGAYLDSAERYVPVTESMAPGHPALLLYDAYRLRDFNLRNVADSSARYAGMLEAYLENETPYDSEMIAELMKYYESVYMEDSAARLKSRLVALEEARKAYENGRRMEARKSDPRLQSFLLKEKGEREDDDKGWILYVSIGVAVVVMAIVVWIAVARRRRNRRGEEKEKELKTLLDDANRNLAAQQISVMHKENAIQNVLDMLEEEGEPTGENRSEILNALRNAVKGNDEWERFSTFFTQVRPGFVKNLTGAYPSLTQGELRLACLISIGLDNKQISRLLGIQLDSVKKARHRLRNRLGIGSDITFEAFFAEF